MENKKLCVCIYCLMAIESREGALPTIPVYLDEEDETPCDWCGEVLETTLYEIQ